MENDDIHQLRAWTIHDKPAAKRKAMPTVRIRFLSSLLKQRKKNKRRNNELLELAVYIDDEFVLRSSISNSVHNAIEQTHLWVDPGLTVYDYYDYYYYYYYYYYYDY